ncbi:SagB/ThcOx family dehydrogenase [Nostocoides sp. F2B08]|uniref:SagB/ThcOx family dehydrogenase n=1 Tax=Nostocoides sp. F2B08 TaxID=2653936 RepID=UPI00126357C2|nr:SagB/ThcOx family dehydrogenase [Tetrasphaera sp. F2B08]KAB7741884.1 SagB/ThcOx family dehydrogenase [Tetrasphaera sp. F2B08]
MFRADHPLAWSFHDATARTPYNMHGLNKPRYETPPFREHPLNDSIDLPEAAVPEVGLQTLIRGRRSCRRFAADPLSLSDLATLLYVGYGVISSVDFDGLFLERPVPSGGGLYPLELSVIAQRVDGLDAGSWHYVPLGHRVESMHAHPFPPLMTAEMFLGQPYLAQAAAIIVITSVVERSLWKYDDRGYRYILLEAGHVAQNVNLCATGLGLGSLNLGGFFDSDLLGVVRADPSTEIALYGVAVGRAATEDRVEVRTPPAEDGVFRRY